MKFALIAAALASLALAAPLQRRQCYVTAEGEQHCLDNPVCHKLDDGTIACVAKRDPEVPLVKRQCYITEDGEQICNDKPNCTIQPDGSKVCVL